MRVRVAVLASLCALVFALPVQGAAADVVGTWTVDVTLDSGPIPPAKLVLRSDGAKLTGVFTGQQGDMPVEASVKDQAVTVWFTVPTQEGPIAVTMKGTADGDRMTGTADLGGRGQAEWTARRTGAAPPTPGAAGTGAPASGAAAPGALNVTGTWAMAVETGAGSGTPTIVLKQDGEALTGHYTGQLGEAPVTGTIKGSAVEFGFDLSVQGTALHVVYAGTAGATSMKGTVKLGEFGEGTFTGKKQ